MMNFRIVKLLPVFVAAYLVAGCEADISGSLGEDPDAGRADFSTFVAVGDSLTAGFSDSALYRHGQENSYPAILAQQFALVGGGSFVQPLRGAEFTGSFVGIPTVVARDRLMIVSSGNPDPPVTPATIDPTVSENLAPMPGTLYNNFGVPLAKSFHLTSTGYGDLAGLGAMPPTANPFYVRFAFDPGVTSMIDDAGARNSSFFVLWIGSNDILLNAASGSPGPVNPSIGLGATDVTDPAKFAMDFPVIVDALKSPTNKGIVINVPDVSGTPYFTTVPYNAIELTADQAAALNANANLMAYNTGMDTAAALTAMTDAEAARRKISYQEGINPILIVDEDLFDLSGFSLPDYRPATEDDLILLPASTKIGVDSGGLYGIAVGLDDGDVLTPTEAAAIEAVRVAYNATIKTAADANPDILFFDVATLIDELNSTGFSYGSGGISAAFILGGAYSADGIHPTARGYAVIANEIFKVINEGFDAYIPPIDPGDYTTVFYQ